WSSDVCSSDLQDLAGDRLEVGAEMHRALQRQDLLCGRLDPEMPQHRLIGSLLLAAGDDDARAADPQQRHRSELHLVAAIEGTGRGEVAVAETLDGEARLER